MEREPTVEEREKIGSATGGCKAGRGGEGGVGKCSRHRRMTTLTVAIFGCHLKNKGNKNVATSSEATFQDKRFVLRSQLTSEASAALRAAGVAAPPTLSELS
jgi:hypothetical protein